LKTIFEYSGGGKKDGKGERLEKKKNSGKIPSDNVQRERLRGGNYYISRKARGGGGGGGGGGGSAVARANFVMREKLEEEMRV